MVRKSSQYLIMTIVKRSSKEGPATLEAERVLQALGGHGAGGAQGDGGGGRTTVGPRLRPLREERRIEVQPARAGGLAHPRVVHTVLQSLSSWGRPRGSGEDPRRLTSNTDAGGPRTQPERPGTAYYTTS